jgi:hypothetical protein
VKDLSAATFNNCIIYGSYANEMSLNKNRSCFEYQFNNCLIKFDNISNQFSTNPLYQFSTDTAHNAIILNKDPNYFNQSQNKFNIDETLCLLQREFDVFNSIGHFRIQELYPWFGSYQNKTFPK